MGRFYVEYDMARFHRKDITLVDMELIDGRKFENLEPRRLFPLSGLEKYITLLDQEGVEQALEKIQSIDIEKLNQAIASLNDVVEPLAKLTKIF